MEIRMANKILKDLQDGIRDENELIIPRMKSHDINVKKRNGNVNVYSQNEIDHYSTVVIEQSQIEKYINPTRPTWSTIKKIKLVFAVILILVGVVGLTMFSIKAKQGTILATQIPAIGEIIGKIETTPLSRIVGKIYPNLNICISALLSGLWLVISLNVNAIYIIIIEEVRLFSAFTIYYQICFQGTIIILTILPLAGVINVYELAFAIALTWAEMLMYLYSDITNALTMFNWEMIDNAKNGDPSNPVATFRRFPGKHASTPWLKFCFTPIMGAIVIHLFCWIIIMIHLLEAIESSTYGTDRVYVGVVILTAVIQMFVPLIKLAQLLRPPIFISIRFYKCVVMIIEIIQFINIIVIAIAIT